MKLLSVVYFRNNYGAAEKGDVGKIVRVQDSDGLYSVMLTKSYKVVSVPPHIITTTEPTPESSVFQSLRERISRMSLSSIFLETPIASANSSSSTSRSGHLTSFPSGRQTMEEIRADVLARQYGEDIACQYEDQRPVQDSLLVGIQEEDDTSIKTDSISIISHVHGRQRRAERNIQRKELQAAIKYGQKEAANPGRDGSKRWRYTHKDVVFVTDITSRHEVTSWRLDGFGDDESDFVAAAEVQLVGSKCHAVLIVDHSGSMRTSDVPGYDSRSHAVYECLKRDFAKEQLKSGTATDVVVTVISMSNTATVLLHKKPLNESLIEDLQRLSKRRPMSHGNYIPALDKALEVMRADAKNASNLLLLFFSDGAPSDQTYMKCVHGMHLFNINRKIDPKMGHKTKAQAWKCVHGIASSVERECCQRVKAIGKMFGPDKVIFRTLAFGPPKENFTLLEKMANVLPRGEFEKLGLNAVSLKTSFSSLSSSLSTLRTEGGHRVLTRRSDKVVDKNQRVDKTGHLLKGADGWFIYSFGDVIGKYEFKDNINASHKLGRVNLEGKANGIAFLEQPFAEGAERFVYRCTEVAATAYGYDYAASSYNVVERYGLRLVAKEAKDIENHHQGRKFHETFARIQADAGDLARSFTRQLPRDGPEWNLNFIKTHIYGCYDLMYKNGRAWILVEPELDGKFTKWNNNAGDVRGQTTTRRSLSGMGGIGFLEELEESDEEDDSSGPMQVDHVPQAFSHFSYESSGGKQLVCDLQGVWNADDGYVLTDPVIHYVCSRGRKHTNGATDKGISGVKNFFKTHVCNSLCNRMGLQKRTPATLIKQ